MRKTVPGASIKMAIAVAVLRSAGTQHCNNAWPTDLGVAAVHRVRTRPRRNHPRQLDPGGAKATRAQRLRQLGDVRRDPPRFAWSAALHSRRCDGICGDAACLPTRREEVMASVSKLIFAAAIAAVSIASPALAAHKGRPISAHQNGYVARGSLRSGALCRPEYHMWDQTYHDDPYCAR